MPNDEEERLKNLKEYDILDTAPEMVFDELTELAAEILQCPVSTIQFLSEDRQVFKSKYGPPDDLVETPRDMAICSHTICQNDLLLVPDLTLLMLCANLECPDKALDPAWTDPENSPRLGTNWIAEEAPCLPA